MENRRIKWRVIKAKGKGGVITLDFYSSRVASRKNKIEIRRNVILASVLFLFAFSWIRWTLEVVSIAAVITEYFDSASRSRRYSRNGRRASNDTSALQHYLEANVTTV